MMRLDESEWRCLFHQADLSTLFVYLGHAFIILFDDKLKLWKPAVIMIA